MEFSKIQVTKQGTLNATYKNEDGDIIDFKGANVIHKDLKEAMRQLVPHVAIITEQREAFGQRLEDLRGISITDEGDNVYKRLTIDSVTFTSGGDHVAIGGTRILTKTGVISLATPNIDLTDSDTYEFNGELDIDIEAVKYEAREYIQERKWGVKQAEIDFKDIQPFDNVEAGDVPEADAAPAPKKRGRKSKKEAA